MIRSRMRRRGLGVVAEGGRDKIAKMPSFPVKYLNKRRMEVLYFAPKHDTSAITPGFVVLFVLSSMLFVTKRDIFQM